MQLKEIIEKLKNNILHMGIYFLAALIPMGIKLLINPLIALNMEPTDYAIVGFFNSFNGLLAPLISFYAFGYYTKRYFEVNEEERMVLKVTIFKSLVYFSLLISAISLLGIYIYMHFFNKESSIPFFPYAFLSVFSIPLTGIVTLQLTDYKMQKKSQAFFRLSLSNGLTLAFLIILLVVIIKLGAFGRMSATFLGTLLMFAYVLKQEWNLFKKKIDWSIFRSMLLFVWPLMISAMLHFFTNGYDRVYLERLGNNDELGFYIVAVQIVGYIAVFRTAIGSTFQPDIYKAVVERSWRTASKYMFITVLSTTLIVLVFMLLAPIIIDVLTAGKYTYSTKYARVLAFSQITQALYFIGTDITIVLGFTKLALINKIVGVMLTIYLYGVLISNWGFIGAAWGQVSSYLLLMFVNILFLWVWIKKRGGTSLKHDI